MKNWLSTVPDPTEIGELVSLAKVRWRIEREDQDVEVELGPDQGEGRN